jgi:hypothetical protein
MVFLTVTIHEVVALFNTLIGNDLDYNLLHFLT